MIRIAVALAILCLSFPSPVTGAPLSVTAGPYLPEVTGTTATVAIHTAIPSSATVRLQLAGGTRSVASPMPGTSHFIMIDALTPGRRYPYEVVVADPAGREAPVALTGQIQTAVPPGNTFRFVVYGDTRPGESATVRHHRDVVREAGALEPSFALVLGDMVDQGDEIAQWESFFRVESAFLRNTAVFPVLGDNDHGRNNQGPPQYFPRLQRGYYRFDWGGIPFFGLNIWDSKGKQKKSDLDETSGQYRWLRQQLSLPEVKAAPFRVVFLHDPVYISRGRSAEIMKKKWAPLFEEGGVDLVFASWHLYERSSRNGVTYVISGGAGAELIWLSPDPSHRSQAEARDHHFCRVDVEENLITLRAVSTDGTVLDSFSLTPRSAGSHEAPERMLLADRIGKEYRFAGTSDRDELEIRLFSNDCPYCRRLIRRIVPALAERHRITIRLTYFDMAIPESYDLMLSAGRIFGRQNMDLPAIFIGRRILGGETEIKTGLEEEIRNYRNHPETYTASAMDPFDDPSPVDGIRDRTFRSLSPWFVAGAGMVDGLNPCAFSTIILLVSYLTLFGADRRQVYRTGVVFTLAVFLTYLVSGITFFHTLKSILAHTHAVRAVNLVILFMVLVLAGASLFDFFAVLRGGMGRAVLKLPARIREGMENHMRRYVRSGMMGVAAPFGLGVVVSGVELTCTGQVYIPIVSMLADPGFRASGLLYLVIYNLAFILPLVLVFFLATWGTAVAGTGKKPAFLATVKLGHAVVFSIMAGILLYNMGWWI